MLPTNLKASLRVLFRNKLISLIHILGLSIGLCAATVIFLMVRYDFNFDHFHKDGDRIYRVVTDESMAGTPFRCPAVPAALPIVADSGLAGLEEGLRFDLFYPQHIAVQQGGRLTPVQTVMQEDPTSIFTDPGYFHFFDYQWLAGNPNNALNAPNTVVLTKSTASKYFPNLTADQVLGQRLLFDDSISATVTGVVNNLDKPSDLIFDVFISWKTMERYLQKWHSVSWGSLNSGEQYFVRLTPGTTMQQFNQQLDRLDKEHDPNYNGDFKKYIHLQPLSDLHFNAIYGTYTERTANKTMLYCLILLGVLLLALACINYINLSTAQASRRAKDVGVRKTLGVTRSWLISRFLGETFILTILASVIALVLTPFLLKLFADFIPPEVAIRPLAQPLAWLFVAGLMVFVTLLAGFYPALVLSGLKPLSILKNQNTSGGSRRAALRKSLTVVQFIIAQVMILGTIMVGKQIYYSLNKDLGYRKDNIVYFPVRSANRSDKTDNRAALSTALRNLPGVEDLCLSSSPPASLWGSSATMEFKEGPKPVTTDVNIKGADEHFLKVYNMKLLAGRNLERNDSVSEYLVNETYAHILGYKDPQQLIGKHLNKHPIVGVVADFYPKSLREAIEPFSIEYDANNLQTMSVLLKPETPDGKGWKNTLASMGKIYKQYYPGQDFKPIFFDDTIKGFYTAERNTERLLSWATGLAILISCMGLLGLVLFTIEIRTKEIGIRKVLGASVSRIVRLLSYEFMALISIAFLVAIPLSWWGAHQWLNNFADRTPMSWWVFGLGATITLGTALLTLGYQTIKAARANPVKSLRAE
jgi:ABC-type lipoprotein release transport system permease subunit